MTRIDCGCGHRPRPDYDVYTDVYMSKEVWKTVDRWRDKDESIARFVRRAIIDYIGNLIRIKNLEEKQK